MVSPVQPRCSRGVVFVWHGILEGSLRNNSTCLRKQLGAVHSSDFAVGFLLFFPHSFACGVVAQLKSNSSHSMITSVSFWESTMFKLLSFSNPENPTESLWPINQPKLPASQATPSAEATAVAPQVVDRNSSG